MVNIFATDPRFEEAARKYGIYLPDGGIEKEEFYEVDFFVKPNTALFDRIIRNRDYYATEAWVEIPEED